MVFLTPCTWRFGILTHCARFSADSVRSSYSASTPSTVFPPFLSRRNWNLVHHTRFHCHSCHGGPESRATSHIFPRSFLAVATKALPLRTVFLTPCTWRFGVLTHCAHFSADSVRGSYSTGPPRTLSLSFLSRRSGKPGHPARSSELFSRGGHESIATAHSLPDALYLEVRNPDPLRTLFCGFRTRQLLCRTTSHGFSAFPVAEEPGLGPPRMVSLSFLSQRSGKSGHLAQFSELFSRGGHESIATAHTLSHFTHKQILPLRLNL